MMDRVLSYQTAVRANSNSSGFDIRQFISKRTCISVSMSIAFLTLILGFMLGKSTSDRHHMMRQQTRRQNELIHRTTFSDGELERIENSLTLMARTKISTNFQDFYSVQYNEVNEQLRQNFTNCIANTSDLDTSQENLENFLGHLIKHEFNSFIKCADSLKEFLQDLQ